MGLKNYNFFYLLAFFVLIFLILTYSYTLEDAQITYRYALRYSEGYPWGTWNRNEVPIEGFTTVLWMFVISLFGPSLNSIAHASKVIGGFSALGLVFLFFTLSVKCQKGEITFINNNFALNKASLFTAIFCALSLPINWYATSGMETVTFIFLISLTLLGPLIKINILIYSLTCIALVAIRPEGIMFAIASTLFFGTRDRRYLYVLFIIIIVFITIFVHRYLLFKEIMPNTYLAKSGDAGLRHLKFGIFYFGSFIISYWYIFLPFLAMPIILKRKILTLRKDNFYFIGIFGIALFYIIIAKSGGDNFSAFPHWRHGLVLLPIVALFSFYTLFQLNIRYSSHIASFICILNFILPIISVFPSSQAMSRFYNLGDFSIQHNMLNNPMFIWLRENNRNDITIATSLAGELPLTVDFNHIDILGLNDRTIAHLGLFDPHGPVDSKTYMSYVIDRMPEIIEAYFPPECVTQIDRECLLRARPMMTMDLLSNPAFVEGYLLIENAPYEYFNRSLFIRKDYYLSYGRLHGIVGIKWLSPFYQ